MKQSGAKPSRAKQADSAEELITQKIAALGDWRGKTLGRMRKLIHAAEKDIVEELKWMGTPVWSKDGILCTGEIYKSIVKLTFAQGASLEDPTGLFNASLEGNTRRAIDLHEGEDVDASAFKALVRAAIALNRAGKSTPATGASVTTKAATRKAMTTKAPSKAPVAKPASAQATKRAR